MLELQTQSPAPQACGVPSRGTIVAPESSGYGRKTKPKKGSSDQQRGRPNEEGQGTEARPQPPGTETGRGGNGKHEHAGLRSPIPEDRERGESAKASRAPLHLQRCGRRSAAGRAQTPKGNQGARPRGSVTATLAVPRKLGRDCSLVVEKPPAQNVGPGSPGLFSLSGKA